MKLIIAISFVASLLATTSAVAKDRAGWRKSGDRIEIRTADISFSTVAGAASLIKTDEFSHKGEGLDNVAQYETPDRALFATIYVYRPAYPDAALTAYETDRGIRARFGATDFADSQVVAAPGHPDSVIRMVYPDGKTDAFNDGAPVATAAAFLRVSGWIVKLRVTAPAPRRADVVATIDALIAGMKVGRKAHVFPAKMLRIAAPCPGSGSVAMPLPKSDKSAAGVLAAAMTSIVVSRDPTEENADLPPSFPDNGLQTACVRGKFAYGDGTIELLQSAGTASPDTIVGLLNDAGTMIVLDRALITPGYDLKMTQIGIADIYGSFDSVPSTAQIAELLSGKSAPGGARRARVTFSADGNSKVELEAD